MRTLRFFVDATLAVDAEVELPRAAADHALRVLRLRDGARVVLFNGDGRDYAGTLGLVGKGRALVALDAALPARAESPLSITLAQSVARGEKMDLVLQKATELGVARIQPLLSERTEVRLDAERTAKRLEHWRQVVASACEQSGRARVPELAAPLELGAFVATAAALPPTRFVLHPDGRALPSHGQAPRELVLAIGPEGGFAEREVSALRHGGFESLALGPRILRTETAGLAAIAVLQATWGDLG